MIYKNIFRSFIFIGFFICFQLPTHAVTIENIPSSIKKSLKAANLPETALGYSVIRLSNTSNVPSSFGWQSQQGMNPASTMKILTTLSALDLLGANYHWKTNVLMQGTIDQGVLKGTLFLQGSGDPKFVPEELSQIVGDIRQLGVQEIDADLVFDRSAYATDLKSTAPMDGESSKTYNVTPDALLYAFQTLSFNVSIADGQPQVVYTPRLAGLHINNLLDTSKGSCGDWTKFMKPTIHQMDANHWDATFLGKIPNSCGEILWNVVTLDANDFLKQGLMASWEDAGGKWARIPNASTGKTPTSAKLLVSHPGISLGDAVKDTNKYSNNVMARQIFLTLSLEKGIKPASTVDSTRILKEWLKKNHLEVPELVVENGSGLSNIEKISPASMTQLLQFGVKSKSHDVFINSLPIAGIDGTMKHRLIDQLKKIFQGTKSEIRFKADPSMPEILQHSGAYMKTGTLKTVRAVAGYVVSKSGEVYAVSSMVSHPQAALGGSKVNDALLGWVLNDCLEN